jgi:hypothetical protein
VQEEVRKGGGEREGGGGGGEGEGRGERREGGEGEGERREGKRDILIVSPFVSHSFFMLFFVLSQGRQKSPNLVLDVGSNTGLFSLIAAVYNTKRIYAFDPQRLCARCVAESAIVVRLVFFFPFFSLFIQKFKFILLIFLSEWI